MKAHLIALLGFAVAGSLISAGTVAAAPAEHVKWHDEGSGYIEFCEDIPPDLIRYDFSIDGRLTIARHGDGLQYFTETYEGSVVWTNTETGKTFTERRSGVSKDLTVTSNGDDTLTIVALGAGSFTYFDADGRRLFSDNGQLRWSVLIDDGGTPGDYTDDEFISDLGVVKGSTGTNGTDGRDFCDDLVEFTY